MKKLFAMILAAMMILCSCAFAETTDNSLQAILDKGTLVLGLDASFEPMGYTNMDGEIVGYDIDLAKEVCARLGVELVVQPIEWAAKELELSSGNIDCIWNCRRTPAARSGCSYRPRSAPCFPGAQG